MIDAEQEALDKQRSQSANGNKVFIIAMIVIIGVMMLGMLRVYYGGNVGLKVVFKESPSFTDTFVNLDELLAKPMLALSFQHAAVKNQLQEMGVLETDEAFQARIQQEVQDSVREAVGNVGKSVTTQASNGATTTRFEGNLLDLIMYVQMNYNRNGDMWINGYDWNRLTSDEKKDAVLRVTTYNVLNKEGMGLADADQETLDRANKRADQLLPKVEAYYKKQAHMKTNFMQLTDPLFGML